MIPLFTWTTIELGPITLQVWGLFVALGIFLGAIFSAKFAEKKGLDKEQIYSAGFWIILSAFLWSRLFHMMFYEFQFFLENPVEIIKIWHGGMSVMGGFFGAIIGFLFWGKKEKVEMTRYIDPLIYGLPFGLGCGRIGCFLIHDHPGTITNSPLGIQQADGTSIHDHGLYLSINGFILALFFFVMQKKERQTGFYAQVFLIWYGGVRFFLDFYRIVDTRYYSLTPAQYFSLIMLVSGLLWFLISKKAVKSSFSPA